MVICSRFWVWVFLCSAWQSSARQCRVGQSMAGQDRAGRGRTRGHGRQRHAAPCHAVPYPGPPTGQDNKFCAVGSFILLVIACFSSALKVRTRCSTGQPAAAAAAGKIRAHVPFSGGKRRRQRNAAGSALGHLLARRGGGGPAAGWKWLHIRGRL